MGYTETGGTYPELRAVAVDPEDGPTFVYTGRIPLFYGHYWRTWSERQQDLTEYTACVDFSAVAGGPLVAYRWNGEATITCTNYVPHDPDVVAQAPSA